MLEGIGREGQSWEGFLLFHRAVPFGSGQERGTKRQVERRSRRSDLRSEARAKTTTLAAALIWSLSARIAFMSLLVCKIQVLPIVARLWLCVNNEMKNNRHVPSRLPRGTQKMQASSGVRAQRASPIV